MTVDFSLEARNQKEVAKYFANKKILKERTANPEFYIQ